MLKRFLSSPSNSITSAAIILGAASLVSRLVGIVRDRVLAHQYGAGDVMDAYYAAFRIPDTIYNLLIVGALAAGFIPVFVKLLNKDKDEAWKVTNSVINILVVFMAIICSILFIFTPQITKLLVPGFDTERLQMTVMLTRIMFLSPILLGISGIVGGVLQAKKNFFIYSLSPIMYNVGIIIGATILVPIMGIKGLAWGVILGALMHLCIQLPTLFKQGFKYQNVFLWRDPNVREIGKLMIPRTLGLASNQLNLLIITVLSSTLTAGSIAVFNFANNLQYFPIGIIGVSFAVAALPTLAELFAENKKTELINNLNSTIRQILFFIIPITILFLLLRAQIVRVVYGTGKFDWNDTINTANVLAFFSLSLFAQCLIPLLARAFYAMHNTWLPFIIGISSDVVNIFLGLFLKEHYGIAGLAMSFSLAMVIQMSLLWLMLRRQLGTLQESKIVITLFKLSIGAIFMALAIQFLKNPLASIVDMTKFWGIFTQGFVSGMVGIGVYILVGLILKTQEMLSFVEIVKKKLFRAKDLPVDITEVN